MCPVCTVAVGAGLGISRALGIDDAVTSVWIGGLILSVSFWTDRWLTKNKLKIPFPFILAFWAASVFIPLYVLKYLARPFNTIWGIDKIIFGTLTGSAFFLAGIWADIKERKLKGKQLFGFQRVVFPVISLIIASAIVYFLTK